MYTLVWLLALLSSMIDLRAPVPYCTRKTSRLSLHRLHACIPPHSRQLPYTLTSDPILVPCCACVRVLHCSFSFLLRPAAACVRV